MKKLNKAIVLGYSLVLVTMGLALPTTVFAATSPTLVGSASYSVLGATTVTNTGGTTTTGDVGVSAGAAITGFPPGIAGGDNILHLHPNDASAIAAQADNLIAFGALDQPCTTTYPGIQDLTLVSPLVPGVYCAPAFTLTGNLTLNGSGVWIFKSASTLITSPGSSVTGGDPCNVWWRVASSATLDTTTSFIGNILALTAATLNNGATLDGRVMVQTAAITLNNNTISGPICSAPATFNVVKSVVNDDAGVSTASNFNLHVTLAGADVVGSPAAGAVAPGTTYTLTPGTYVVSEDAFAGYTTTFGGDCNAAGSITLAPGDNKTCTVTNNDVSPLPASINVVKTVINDNGRTKVIADFPLFVNGVAVVSGVTNVFPAPLVYAVTETTDSNYTRTFSGDCDASGNITLAPGDSKFCIVTNNDIAASSGGGGGAGGRPPVIVPPIIDVVKVPSPLALPDGAGLVNYTYTLRNIGTVPVTDITMVGDTCSPIVLSSGDTDTDSTLDLNETWVYRCSTTLTETHTNTVVATGWANGISATDIASATVVVGSPVVPPLIHITKVPSPLTLPYGGGFVTYTKEVTNPGIVPLSNVRVTDDKCGPVNYVSGDTNSDSLLDTTETWTYTCRSNLTVTTLNTATATGEANGQTVRDLALATVVVAGAPAAVVPSFPNTGFGLTENIFVLPLMAVSVFAISFFMYVAKKS